MTKQELGVFICRVLSIYVFIQFCHYLGHIGAIIEYLPRNTQLTDQDVFAAFCKILPVMIILSLTISLWIFAKQISILLTYDLHPSEKISRIDPAIILGFAVMICGFFIFFQALSRLSSDIFSVFIMYSDKMAPKDLFRRNAFNLFIVCSKFAIAYVFIRQPYRVTSFLTKQTPNNFKSSCE
jgi:drug/metabolite transporter (DMT)-like permease